MYVIYDVSTVYRSLTSIVIDIHSREHGKVENSRTTSVKWVGRREEEGREGISP